MTCIDVTETLPLVLRVALSLLKGRAKKESAGGLVGAEKSLNGMVGSAHFLAKMSMVRVRSTGNSMLYDNSAEIPLNQNR